MSIDKIKKRIKIIQDLQEEVRKIKVNYEDSFNNNSVVQDMQKKEEELKMTLASYKEKVETVKEEPVLKAMIEDMKDLKEQIKENKEVLSQELVDYYRETGSMEIVDTNGETYHIKFDAKLKN